jgi:hypothetical protein
MKLPNLFRSRENKDAQIKEVTGIISKLEKQLGVTEESYKHSIEFVKNQIEIGNIDSAKKYATFAAEMEFQYKSIEDALYVSNCVREYLCTGNFPMSKYEQLRRQFLPDAIELLTKSCINYEHRAKEIACELEAKIADECNRVRTREGG